MKRNFKHLVITLGSSLLLAGCCTPRNASQWEYKVAYAPAPNSDRHEVQEALLNDFAKDGWVFVAKDANGAFIFKRAKK